MIWGQGIVSRCSETGKWQWDCQAVQCEASAMQCEVLMLNSGGGTHMGDYHIVQSLLLVTDQAADMTLYALATVQQTRLPT